MRGSSMRVLLVHNFYQVAGGEDAVVRQELSLLRENGVDVELFSVSNDDIKGITGGIATALKVVYSPSARRAVAKKVATFLPDVVHIHNFFPLLSPSILDACLDAGVPSVMTLHNFRILSPGALLHPVEQKQLTPRRSCWWTVPKKVYRNSAAATLAVATMVEFHKWIGTWTRKVDRFIALTDWARRIFQECGLPQERIMVKANFVAKPRAFGGLQRSGGLFVGRLCEQKGIDVMLRAWKDVDYPLKIIGDGPLCEFVRNCASDRILYLGRLPQEVVQREMQAAKFLVFPSSGSEMFPMTVVEAFSSHLPVVCSDLPSIGELVKRGVTGLTFPPGDPNALAAAVRWAISNPLALDEIGRRAHQTYEEQYTPETNFNQLISIYRSVRRIGTGSVPDRQPPFRA
jgi:glycosyltransferase involved in cell wall biosynthesis